MRKINSVCDVQVICCLFTSSQEVEVEEVMMPRFRKITDAHAIKELDKIKETLWNKN